MFWEEIVANSNKEAAGQLHGLAGVMTRLMLLAVFFLVAVSLNIVIVMRSIYNKLVLLGPNMREEGNRVSFFRILPVSLTRVGASGGVFRQLWVSFFFDSLELVTLAVWMLYPVFVVAFWVVEHECSHTTELLPGLDFSPFFACAVAVDRFIVGVGVGMAVLMTTLLVLYILRFIEERYRLQKKPVAKLTHVAVFGVVLGLMSLLTFLGMLVSLLMFVTPLLATGEEVKERISLAYPALVLLCGCFFVLLYLGKKITFAISIHINPDTSFFFESGCSITGTAPVNNLATTDKEAGVDMTTYASLSEPLLL